MRIKKNINLGIISWSKKTILGDIINNWFIRQHAFIEIWSMQEVWRARKMRKSCSWHSWEQLYIASWVLSKLPKCFISWWTHSWRMNQLFYNIFNPMENFFCWGIHLLMSWTCSKGTWGTLVQLNLMRQIY